MNIRSLLLASIALPLMSACVLPPQISPEDKAAFTGLAPVTVVIQKTALQQPATINKGAATDSIVIFDPDEENEFRQIRQALEKYQIDVKGIVLTKMNTRQAKHPLLQAKAPAKPNTTLKISITMFSQTKGKRNFVTSLGLTGSLYNAQGKLILERYKYVNNASSDLPDYPLDELVNSPQALRTSIANSAAYASDELLTQLEEDLGLSETAPVAVKAAETAPLAAPAGAQPTSGQAESKPVPVAKSAPVQTQPAPKTKPKMILVDGVEVEEQPSCNGWCGMPGGKFKWLD